MNDRIAPAEIWLDLRVAVGIPTEPDEEKKFNGVEQVRYFSADRVKELVDLSSGGPEFIIQITTPAKTSAIFALTNYGRMFVRTSHDTGGQPFHSWKPFDGPDLGTPANVESTGG
jgi:hypothetical protein